MERKRIIDINADLGEGYGVYRYGEDDAIIPHVTSANVAAGFHASDPVNLMHTVSKVVAAGARLGAHIGYPDRLGFGRRSMRISARDAYAYTLYQLGAVQGFSKSAGAVVSHVKLHGAMYMDACELQPLAEAAVRAVKDFDGGLCIYTLPGSQVETECVAQGVEVWPEYFADRPYVEDTVQMFDWEVSELGTPTESAKKTLEFLEGDYGEAIRTVCVHSDTPGAPLILRSVRQILAEKYEVGISTTDDRGKIK